MGAGKTAVILIWVSRVRLILLYNSKKNCKSVLYDLFFTTRLPAPTTSPNLSFKVSLGVIQVYFFLISWSNKFRNIF